MTMRPVVPGVISTGTPCVNPSHVVVLVHPFLGEQEIAIRRERLMGHKDAMLDRLEKKQRLYLTHLEELLTHTPHPIVTFEEEIQVGSTRTRFGQYATGERHFIPTAPADPEPIIGWGRALAFLERFDAKLLLGGGYLTDYPGPIDGYTGCLGGTIQEIARAGIPYQVIPRLTYQ